MPTRLSRVEQVERNRALVLDAARRVFLTRGYAGATVEAIAEEAGFSRGVVYSQFTAKADMFFALLEQRMAERAEHARTILDTTVGVEGMRRLVQDLARMTAEARSWGRLVLEFRLVAAREPKLNRRYAELHEETLRRLADSLEQLLRADGLTTALPSREVAEILMYIDVGNQLERAAGTNRLDAAAAMEDILIRLVTPL